MLQPTNDKSLETSIRNGPANRFLSKAAKSGIKIGSPVAVLTPTLIMFKMGADHKNYTEESVGLLGAVTLGAIAVSVSLALIDDDFKTIGESLKNLVKRKHGPASVNHSRN